MIFLSLIAILSYRLIINTICYMIFLIEFFIYFRVNHRRQGWWCFSIITDDIYGHPMHIAYTILFDLIFFHRVVLHPNFIDTHKSFTRYKYSLKKISCTPECIDEYFKYHIDVARAHYFLFRAPRTENW